MANYKLLPGEDILKRFRLKLSSMRSGRVTSSILDNIKVEAYGNKMTFVELATITIPEPAQLLISPFDKSLIQPMTKAIRESNLGVNPQDDGNSIRLVFPPLTEETRKDRVKELHKLKEDSRIEIRQRRQELIKHKKTEKENGLIAEDQFNVFEKNLQEEVNNLNSEIDDLSKNKEEEIMRV